MWLLGMWLLGKVFLSIPSLMWLLLGMWVLIEVLLMFLIEIWLSVLLQLVINSVTPDSKLIILLALLSPATKPVLDSTHQSNTTNLKCHILRLLFLCYFLCSLYVCLMCYLYCGHLLHCEVSSCLDFLGWVVARGFVGTFGPDKKRKVFLKCDLSCECLYGIIS